MLVEYRFRLHDGNAATLATFRAGTGGTALEVTSVRDGVNPYLAGDPTGEGSEQNPLTGKVNVGAFSGEIIDVPTTGTSRLFTSLLEDATQQDQLGDRWAAWDIREDGGAWENLITGYLTQYRLASDICWNVTVSDPFRVANEFTAFAPHPDDTIADFLARWPRRGCLIGGPVRGGGFLGTPDLGGIEVFAWEAFTDLELPIGPLGSGAMTHLAFVSGYVPPDLKRTTKAADVGAVANPASDAFKSQVASRQPAFADALGKTFYPGLVHEITDPSTGAKTYFSVDNGWKYKPTFYNGRTDLGIIVDKRSISGLFAVGSIPIDQHKVLRLRTFSILPTEQSPIYDTLHPVDWITRLWSEAGLAYDATSVEAVRAQLGTHLRVSLRITGTQKLQSFLEETFYGPFGIGVRNGSDGKLQLYSSRIFASVAPAVQVTEDDVEDGATQPFELRSETAINKVIIECQRLVPPTASSATPYPWQDGDIFTARAYMNRWAKDGKPAAPPADGVAVQDIRYERVNDDAGATGRGEVTYSIPGVVHVLDAVGDAVAAWVNARAREIFNRWGRGIREGESVFLATGAGADAQLGNEVLFGVPELPNHNKRLGDDPAVPLRAVQIVRLTRSSRGKAVKLLDSGAGAQPLPTAPTITIAASTANPTHVARVTVTNAATLNAAGYGLRLQMAVTTGAAPAAGDRTDVVAYGPGQIPTDPIDLPAVSAGRTVYAYAFAELSGYRPSSTSAPASVTLTGLTAPSGLTATPDGTDGSLCLLAWTIGEASLVSDVYLRKTADPAAAEVRVQQLDPGSLRYTLEGLTAGVGYTASVLHRDLATGDVSARATVAFAAGASLVTLSAPSSETVFAGSYDRNGIWQRDGIYGLAVVATERPGYLRVQEAVETASGAGTYGSWADVGRVASVQGAWTIWRGTAPNDGLRRKLRGRHERDGATASVWTDELVITPWTALPLGPYPTEVLCRVKLLDPLNSTEAATLIRVQVDYVDPAGTAGTVQLTSLTANSSVSSGPAVGAAPVASGQIWKLARPAGGAGMGEAVFQAFGNAGSPEGKVQLPEQGSGPSLTVTPTPGSSSWTIAWSGTNVTLSINGGAYAAPPASPFSVSRNGPGGAFKEYAFKSVVGSETMTDSVSIPPTDKDTVTPDLSVVQTTKTSTTTEFTATVAIPGGGVFDLQAQIYGDATWYYSTDGGASWIGPYSAGTILTGMSSGWKYRCMRAAFNSGQSTMKWRASISGGGAEEIQRTIPNQDKTSFGPTLYLNTTQGSTSYSIGYTSNGTVEYAIDNGAWSTPPSNPFTVSRNAAGGNDKVVHVRATLDGQTVPDSVTVPAQGSGGGGGSTTTAVIDHVAITFDAVNNWATVSWTYTGALGVSGSFQLLRILTDGTTTPDLNQTPTVVASFLSGSPYNDGSHGYTLTSGAGPNIAFSYLLRVVDSGTTLSNSGWYSKATKHT